MGAGSLPPSSIEALRIFSGQPMPVIRAAASPPTVSPIKEQIDDPTETERSFPTLCFDKTRLSFISALNNAVNHPLGRENRKKRCDLRMS